MQYNSKKLLIKRVLEAVLLNVGAVDSIDLNDGKLGLSLCLFEVANYLNHEPIEDTALTLLQEVLALRQKGKKVRPLEIGFVLLYLIENNFLEADFDDLFGEDKEQLLYAIHSLRPYSEFHLLFIPFLSLLWNLKKQDAIQKLIEEILEGTALSLQEQQIQIQTNRFLKDIEKLENSFEYYLKVSSLSNNSRVSLKTLEQYAVLYQQGWITNRFETGFYIEKLVPGYTKQNFSGKIMQEYSIQNVYPDTLTLSQQINLLYLLTQRAPLSKILIQQLEKNLLDCENLMYEKRIAQMIPLDKSIIGYEAGLARLLLYGVYAEKLQAGEDCKRFQYLFT